MWKFEVFKSEDRGWRWRLTLCNTLIVVESPEIYVRRADARAAVDRARTEIGKADIEVL